MLNVGDLAPEIALRDQDGAAWSLSDALRHGELVLYFYPADFTPVCTREACAFRDNFDDLSSVHVQIVGISPQNAASHQRFRDAFKLPFPLLSDENKQAIRAFGVDGPLGFGVRRVTYLIGTDRHIRNRVVSDFFVGGHTDLIRKVVAEAR
jgi:thioredoxin-dependent peroxiredoxin